MRYMSLFIVLIMISSCGTKQKDAAESKKRIKQEYLQKGSEIAGLSQSALLKAVSGAMQKGGPAHAVDYCNLEALNIKDSLSTKNNCRIQRLSFKYRNPEDKPTSKIEKNQLQAFETAIQNGDTARAVVYLLDDRIEYYQPIIIQNGACLVCHGNPETQISMETLEVIRQRYPDDRATGYALNDFRGAWKISFSK